jgi:ELWxxDGT repeat protein
MRARTIGTAAATLVVLTMSAAPALADPAPRAPFSLTPAGDGVFFVAHDQLWHTDGTSGGTRRLTDLSRDESCCVDLTPWGDDLLTVLDGPHSYEPWFSDGTPAGTDELADIVPGTTGSFPDSFTVIGDRAFFNAEKSYTEPQVWQTDGTPSGTSQVEGALVIVGVLDGALYYSGDGAAGPGLYRTDGHSPATFVAALAGGAQPAVGTAGGRLYFETGQVFGNGAALWSTDGTPEGTSQLTDPETDRIEVSSQVFEVGGRALFFNYTSYDNYTAQLWTSDGTVAGTHRVSDTLFTESPRGAEAAVADGHLVFRGSPAHPNAPALWSSDGTAAGTVRLDSPDLAHIPDPTGFVPLDGQVYVVARDAALRAALFRTDGTELDQVVPGHGAREVTLRGLTAVGDRVVWTRGPRDATYRTLWTTDGTTAGTHEVRPRHGWQGVGAYTDLTDLDGSLYLSARGRHAPYETLWRSNLSGAHPVVTR